MKRILSLTIAALLLAGCGQMGAETAPISASAVTEPASECIFYKIPEAEPQMQDHQRIYYEIFVRSFRDSNGDGLGDLQGVTETLDYLQKDLGVGGIWLMPIHPSPSYHKYDVLDAYAIDPEYGTMEDFHGLMAQCQKRDIRVIMDLVLNHSSREHPWFQEACRYLRTLSAGQKPDPAACPYVDYYHFLQAEQCPSGYHPVEEAEGWYYEGVFGPHMPDLNFDCEGYQKEIRNILAFWTEKGVDGFRLDAVKEYESGNIEKNIEILRWIQQTAREVNPDCFLVGEVWDSFSQMARYYESGITSIFNYPFGSSDGKIIKVLKGAGNPKVVESYAKALEKADSLYRSKNPHYIDAPFLTNHDVGRAAGFTGRSPEKTKLAGAMNLFMSGNVFIYYGEEIGMVTGAVNDPSYRAPMVWTPGPQSVEPPPGCKLPKAYPFGSLQEQKEDPGSIFSYYQAAAAIRNRIPALSRGIPREEAALNQGCVSAVRKTWEGEACIVLMNIQEEEAEVDLSGYSDWELGASLSAGSIPVSFQEETLVLPPFGVAVMTRKK